MPQKISMAGYGSKRAFSRATAPAAKRARVPGYNRSAFRAGVAAAARAGAGGELKGMDTDIDDASIDAATGNNNSIIVLNLLEQGAGSWNRIGRKVRLDSVRIKGMLQCKIDASSTAPVGGTVRLVLVWDKQPSSGSIPQFDAIFGRTSQDGTETSQFLDNVKYDNTGRFSVLRDVVCAFDPVTETTSQDTTMTKYVDEFVKLNGREVVYSGQSDPLTIADISSGALYLCYRASADSATGTQFSVTNGTSRLRFKD